METDSKNKEIVNNLLANVPVYLQKVKCDTTPR